MALQAALKQQLAGTQAGMSGMHGSDAAAAAARVQQMLVPGAASPGQAANAAAQAAAAAAVGAPQCKVLFVGIDGVLVVDDEASVAAGQPPNVLPVLVQHLVNLSHRTACILVLLPEHNNERSAVACLEARRQLQQHGVNAALVSETRTVAVGETEQGPATVRCMEILEWLQRHLSQVSTWAAIDSTDLASAYASVCRLCGGVPCFTGNFVKTEPTIGITEQCADQLQVWTRCVTRCVTWCVTRARAFGSAQTPVCR